MLLIIMAAAGVSTSDESFVQRKGHQLMLGGQPWYFLGANAYWLMDMATEVDKRPIIDRFFSHCNEYGLTVIRLWGFNRNCPQAVGVYDEQEMQGFDYIIYSARKHSIRLVFALGNTWPAYKSPEDFMTMAGIPPDGQDILTFYQSDAVKGVYKNHITHMVNRYNTLTGLRYMDDSTIMMWDVFNEPRCPGCVEAWQQELHHSWLQDMAAHLHTQAPWQLVAAGTEG